MDSSYFGPKPNFYHKKLILSCKKSCLKQKMGNFFQHIMEWVVEKYKTAPLVIVKKRII